MWGLYAPGVKFKADTKPWIKEMHHYAGPRGWLLKARDGVRSYFESRRNRSLDDFVTFRSQAEAELFAFTFACQNPRYMQKFEVRYIDGWWK